MVSGLALASQVAEATHVQGTAIAEHAHGQDSPGSPGTTTRMIQRYLGSAELAVALSLSLFYA
jgi:hypothetical protein